MKKLIILSTALLFTACVSSNVTERDEFYAVWGYDFTEYTEIGFMFTPEMYHGDYESVGLIEISYSPSFLEIPGDARGDALMDYQDSQVYRDPIETKYWRVSRPSSEELIEKAYNQATELGADAIVNFRMVSDTWTNGQLEVGTLTLRGFAIKRTN